MLPAVLAILICLALCPASALAVPKNDILIVQTAYFDFDSTKTIQEVMDGYSFFSKVEWLEFRDKDDNDQKVVEARGYYDLDKIKFRLNVESCSKTEDGYTGVTTTRPYLRLRYRPDFLKQRCTLLSISIQGLSDGASLNDTNGLWVMTLFTNELPDASVFCAAPPEKPDDKAKKEN